MIRPLLVLTALVAAPAAYAAGPDWDGVAEERVIHVITRDEDGDLRDTKVWLAVLDGQGFLRTGSSTWAENLERDPDLVLRIRGTEYPLRADFVENQTLRERVAAAFREKYGWQDAMVGWMRGAQPKIMHMVSR